MAGSVSCAREAENFRCENQIVKGRGRGDFVKRVLGSAHALACRSRRPGRESRAWSSLSGCNIPAIGGEDAHHTTRGACAPRTWVLRLPLLLRDQTSADKFCREVCRRLNSFDVSSHVRCALLWANSSCRRIRN